MGQMYEVPDGKTLVVDGPCRVVVIGDPGKQPVTGDPVAASQPQQKKE